MFDLTTILFVFLGVVALVFLVRSVDLLIDRVFGEGSTKEQADEIAMECKAYAYLVKDDICSK